MVSSCDNPLGMGGFGICLTHLETSFQLQWWFLHSTKLLLITTVYSLFVKPFQENIIIKKALVRSFLVRPAAGVANYGMATSKWPLSGFVCGLDLFLLLIWRFPENGAPVIIPKKIMVFSLIWLVLWNIFYFPIYWVANHPNWLSYFSEGWPNHQPVINQASIWGRTPILGHLHLSVQSSLQSLAENNNDERRGDGDG